MDLERVCEAGAGPPILIQHYQNSGSRSIHIRAGVQAPGGKTQGRSLKALGGPHRVYKRGSITGTCTAEWCAPHLHLCPSRVLAVPAPENPNTLSSATG